MKKLLIFEWLKRSLFNSFHTHVLINYKINREKPSWLEEVEEQGGN